MKLLLVVAVLGCLAAYTMADAACGPLQKLKVKHQWDKVWGEGGAHRLDVALHVWGNFFRQYPKAKELFDPALRADNIFSPQFKAFSQRSIGGVGMVIDTGDDVEAIKVMLGVLKTLHAEKGIKPEYFDAFKDELMVVIARQVGIRFDWDAWNCALSAIVNELK